MADNASLASRRLKLSDETKKFVARALKSDLIELSEMKQVVGSLLAQKCDIDSKAIVKAAVGAGHLTRWQGKQLLAGHFDGFFLGNYKLLKPLGAGGMGVVYLAEHNIMQRRMALKILPVAAMQDKTRVARFQGEARAAAQLDHPNIVRAYDFSEAGGKAFIVMEFVDGMDLHHVVARDGVMSFRAAVEVLMQAADGLSHAHSRGIIHRDIKPSNLMLRQDGVLKISDMGLARIGYQSDGNITSEGGGVMGTSDFLAPEQALDSHGVDGRADIYALGCTLYYLLTKQPPYPSENLASRIAKHQTAPPADIRDLRPDCPAALAELAMRMMAKQPADRVPTCNDLLTALRRLVTQGNLGGDAGLSNLLTSHDTAIDDVSLQATSVNAGEASGSLSSGGMAISPNPLDLFDLSSLPDASCRSFVTLGPASSADGMSAYRPPPSAFHSSASAGANTSGGKSTLPTRSANQSLLVGVGLTLAVVAALISGTATILGATREEPSKSPKIKVSEDREGRDVIFIGQ